MHTINTEYKKEKQYVYSRLLFVLGLTLVSFLLMTFFSAKFENRQLFLLKVLLIALSLFSLVHYSLINKFPNTLINIRKFTLLFIDVIALTMSIILIGSLGLFLLPLYIILVMGSGVHFGFHYFYFTLFLSISSWLSLINISSYWSTHSDTVAVFAITTLLIPLIYLKQMMRMDKKNINLHKTLESTSYEANFDTLTGLPNRKQYDSFMRELVKKQAFFALCFIDLNKFKMINDTYGHEVGDEVLKEVSRRLSLNLDEDDLLARLGGDEFVLITTRKKLFLTKFLEKLEVSTIGEHRVNDISVHIELSIGVSLFPDDSRSEIFLRKYADEAMYFAKKQNDRYHVFYEEIKSSEGFA